MLKEKNFYSDFARITDSVNSRLGSTKDRS